MMCRLCDHTATHRGWDGDPEDPTSSIVYVCGIHSVNGDVRMEDAMV